MAKQQVWQFDLGVDGKYSFATAAEVKAWLSADKIAWEKALSGHFDYYFGSAFSQVDGYHNSQALADNIDEPSRKGISISIEDVYKNLVRHESVRGRVAIEAGTECGPNAVSGAIAVFMRRSIREGSNPDTWRGVFTALEHEKSEQQRKAAVGATFEDLHKEINEWFILAKSLIAAEHEASARNRQDTSKACEGLLAEMGAHKAQVTKDLLEISHFNDVRNDQLANKTHGQMNSLVSGAEERLVAIEKTYNDKMSLQAPVAYWNERRERHEVLWKRWLATFVIMVIMIALGLGWYVVNYLPASGTIQNLPVGRLVESIVLVMLSLWIARTAARQYQLNLHLATDAAERAVLIATYLSLLRDGAGVKDNDRQLILGAVFRSSIQSSPDDANPPNFVASVLNK